LSWIDEVPFILKDDEIIILHNQSCNYFGQKFVQKTSGWGVGGAVTPSLGIGSASSTTKKEKSLDYHTSVSMFATNKRLVFIKYKKNFWEGGFKGYGDMVSEIFYESISSVKQEKQYGSYVLILKVGVGMDKISIALHTAAFMKKEKQRTLVNKWEEVINQQREKAKQRIKDSSESEKEEISLQTLKNRLAKGEITIQEYEEIKKILET